MADTPNPETLDALWKHITDIRFAMLTTIDADGAFRSRPLTTQSSRSEDPTMLYFFVGAGSQVANDVANEPRVNLAYADPDDDHYVSIAGRAWLSDDHALKEKLFNPMVKAWFPGGVDDPNLKLLCVKMDQAEYWNVDDNQMVQLFKMVKAAVTGEPPVDMGEHRKVRIG